MGQGSTAETIDGRPYFIYKDSAEKIDWLTSQSTMTFNMECIIKTELSAIKVDFHFGEKLRNPNNFDYFFNLESPEEREILREIRDGEAFFMIFLGGKGTGGTKTGGIKKVELNEAHLSMVKDVFDEAAKNGYPI